MTQATGGRGACARRRPLRRLHAGASRAAERVAIVGVALVALLAPRAWSVDSRSESQSVTSLGEREPMETEPLTVGECVRLALSAADRGQPALASYASAMDAASASEDRQGQARSRLLPQVFGQARYSRTTSNPSVQKIDPNTGTLIAQNTTVVTPNWSYSVNVSQTVWDGQTFSSYRAAGHLSQSAVERERSQRLALGLEVRRVAYELLRAQRLLEVRREALELANAQLRETENRYRLGSAARADLLRAKATTGGNRVDFLRQENVVERGRADLNYLLGRAPDAKTEVVDEPLLPEADPELAELRARADEENPDLVAAGLAEKASRHGVASAKRARYPSMASSLTYGWNAPVRPEGLDSFQDDWFWTVGVSLSVPVFDGWSSKSGIRRATEGRLAAERDFALGLRAVHGSLQTTHASLLEARARADVARESVAAAEEELRLEEERYRLGAGRLIELLDAQLTLASSRSDLINAVYDYWLARSQLARLVGAESL